MQQGVFAGVLVSPDFLARFPSTQNADISGITSSCFFLGAGAGAICAFLLGDKLGRRRTIALGLLCNTIGALLQTLAWHLPQMVVGRLINGFGIGLVSSMSPVYLSECCKSNVRGMLMGIATCCNVGCFCIANWIAYGLYYRGDAFQWRFPLAFQLVFLFIIAPILAVLPDSPRWLLLQDRDEDALFTLSRLMGHNQSVEDADVLAEFASIKAAIRMEREEQVPIRDVLCNRDRTQNLRRLLLSCGTQFFQQFT
jgi:MFS family permease